MEKNMANLDDLIKFIESSESEYDSSSDWKIGLSSSVPNWRSLVADPKNWDAIENVTSLISSEYRLRELVDAGGLGLVKRWFDSEVSAQRNAASGWLLHEANVEVPLWQACDRNMKNALLQHRFERWPGEPFKMLEEYNDEIHHIARRINRGDPTEVNLLVSLSDAMRSLPYIVGYVPSPQIEKLRSIIADADDQIYLTRINEMISRREEACKVTSFQQQQRIPYTTNNNERELIARVMEITRRIGYLPAALPPIFISFETPPIFIAYPELEEEDDEYQIRRNRERRRDEYQIPINRERRRPETISIEELLGVYQHPLITYLKTSRMNR